MVPPSPETLLAFGLRADGSSPHAHGNTPLFPVLRELAIHERRTLGVLSPAERTKLKRALRSYHKRHRDRRIAVQDINQEITLWRLR